VTQVGNDRGLTLLELAVAMLIVVVLASIAIPIYTKFINKARSIQSVSQMSALQKEIMMYKFDEGDLPAALSDLQIANLLDPWERPYRYARFGGESSAEPRVDRSSSALNSDYDLYSLGQNGESALSLAAVASLDDIVRAKDGAYIGLASEY
jgi:general secretion pathway protein G